LVDKRPRLLPFVDEEIADALTYQMRENRVTLRLGEEVSGIERCDDDLRVKIHLASGKQIVTDKALYSIGRSGATSKLSLAAAGVEPDDRGRLKVNANYQTNQPHIYAVGDVIGFPSLASTSMEQGRIAARAAFDEPAEAPPEFFPYGIYAVPEISTIGMTEEQARQRGIPYECGVARFRETSRGHIMGLNTGFMKLLFALDTRRLLGAHIVGEGATELIHIGQAVLMLGGTLEYFVENTFNYPTLAEGYKIAALDAWNRMPRVQPSTPEVEELGAVAVAEGRASA
jgi:NAD(P) transhydrogenase